MNSFNATSTTVKWLERLRMTVARSHSNGGDEKTTNLARKVGHEVDDLVRDNEDEDRAGTHSELLEVDA